MKTYMAKPKEITKDWLVVDATNRVLGRLATEVATVLRGKHKPTFTPHMDTGDYVIVVNADKVRLTGKKRDDKHYYRHSGYVGGLRAIDYGTLLDEKPEFVIKEAVRRMLPKGRLGRALIKKLKIYRGSDHPHEAQRPKALGQ